MPLDEIYVTYLNGQSRGRLATVTPGGTPQNKPVGFRYNAALGTIDIYGYAMETSANPGHLGLQARDVAAFGHNGTEGEPR